tara:strand:- start:2028 stop:2672 length:645 start_codon:yes stop_codon:yes gene_type:complete
MRNLILILISLLSLNSCSQEQKKSELKPVDSLCSCYKETPNNGELGKCLNDYINTHKDQLAKELQITTNDKELAIKKLTKWSGKQMLNVIMECPKYRNDVDSVKRSSFKKENSPLQRIDSLSTVIKKDSSNNNLTTRGKLFISINQLNSAKIDLENALNLDKSNWETFAYLGWVNEENKNFPEAIKLYQKGLKLNEENYYLQIALSLAQAKNVR